MRTILKVLFMPLNILWTLFHFHTTYIAWGKGFWTAVLTFFLPGVAEIYWVIKLWNENPTYVNIFIILAVAGIIKFLFLRGDDESA